MEKIFWPWQWKNALSTLHEKIFWPWQWKRHCRKMSCRHICTFAHLGKCHVVTFAHLHIWENEQQSVRLVISYRGKNEKSSFLSLCLSFENYFLYLYQYLYFCFWRGEQSQKKLWGFGWYFGGGKQKKTVRLIEIQSVPSKNSHFCQRFRLGQLVNLILLCSDLKNSIWSLTGPI